MGQMFEIGDQDLKIVKDTQFMNVRLEVCQQAILYNNVIGPFSQGVLQDTSAFFSDFLQKYENINNLKEFMDDVCNDALIIVQGIQIQRKMHEPVLTAAVSNKMKARVVQGEIGNKFDSLSDDY